MQIVLFSAHCKLLNGNLIFNSKKEQCKSQQVSDLDETTPKFLRSETSQNKWTVTDIFTNPPLAN
jgi:hypothetical protein